MRARTPLPPRELLCQMFRYEPETGKLFWLPRPQGEFKDLKSFCTWNARFLGKEAGTKVYGKGRATCMQVCVTVNGGHTNYKVHHVIYRMLGIEVPENRMIDHANRDPHDNRLSNLRIVTCAQNSANRQRNRVPGPRLPRGVRATKSGTFQAYIKKDNKWIGLGCYPTPEAAHAVWKEAAVRLHGEDYAVLE